MRIKGNPLWLISSVFWVEVGIGLNLGHLLLEQPGEESLSCLLQPGGVPFTCKSVCWKQGLGCLGETTFTATFPLNTLVFSTQITCVWFLIPSLNYWWKQTYIYKWHGQRLIQSPAVVAKFKYLRTHCRFQYFQPCTAQSSVLIVRLTCFVLPRRLF